MANPQDAVEQAFPAPMPNIRDSVAITIRITPYLTITESSHPALISLTSLEMINGMMHSMTTSSDTRTGACSDAFLYSRTHFIRSFNIITVSSPVSCKNLKRPFFRAFSYICKYILHR